MKSKKLIALLLAVVMVLGLGTMASASVPTDRVQINNMMVDATMLNSVNTVSVTSASTTEPTTSLYPPITEINALPYASEMSAGGNQGQRLYGLSLSGIEASVLSEVPVNFVLGGTSVDGSITFDFDSQTETITKNPGETLQVTLDLSNSRTETFRVTWLGTDGTNYIARCRLSASVLKDANSAIADSVSIGSANGRYESTTVGGVTRYNYKIELANGPLTGLTVTVVLRTKNATATLGGANPTTTTDGTSNRTLTFENVDLSSAKELVVTNTTGDSSKTYSVSAYVKDQNITVYVAFRGYLAREWYDGTTTYYNYNANGFGSGSSLTNPEKTQIDTAISKFTGLKGKNAPASVDATTGRPIFLQNSYIEISVGSDKTVKDALIEAIRKYNAKEDGLNPNGRVIAQEGAENNYITSISVDGYSLGEFDCGHGSGWMYTARTNRTDVTTALPNAGVCYWPLSSGMYIDFYYTAAYGADFGYSIFDM